ncbi:FtsW/RodA/SpoVE family cell cycle protein [Peribacillus butanolivorans]
MYFPEAHTDFISTIVAEEFGFIEAGLLISTYFFIIYKIVTIAWKRSSRFRNLGLSIQLFSRY